MNEPLYQIILGIILSPFIGIGTWLKWQTMKTGSIIEIGSFTQKYGKNTGWLLQIACITIFFNFFQTYNLWTVIPLALLIWFISGWVATILERKLYGTEDNIDLIAYVAQQFVKDCGDEKLQEYLDGIAPQWWIRLMPFSWREELTKRINENLANYDEKNEP
jgi:hypothetical protein